MNDPVANPAEMYEQYFVPGMFSRWAKILLDHARPQPGEHGLDIGCGTGAVTRQLAPLLGSKGKVVALDPNPAMLGVARGLPTPEGAPVDWREGRAEALPDGPFDLIVGQQFLQFVPDKPSAAREVRRVLAPGGRGVFAVWRSLEHQPVYSVLCEAEARVMGAPMEEVAMPFSFGDAKALRAVFEGAGFGDVGIDEVTHPVRFPDRARFVENTVLAASAVIPELAKLDVATRKSMVEAIRSEVAEVLEFHSDGQAVEFPMSTHIVTLRS